MYLKPASVVNRVYLSLSVQSVRLVRLHFHPVSALTGGRLVLASSPQLLLASRAGSKAAKVLGAATPPPSTKLCGPKCLAADASGVPNKTHGEGGWQLIPHPLGCWAEQP